MRSLAMALLTSRLLATTAGAEETLDDPSPPSAWRTTLTLSDEGSVDSGLPSDAAWISNIGLAQPSVSWRHGETARAVTSLSGILLSENETTTGTLRVREGYAGVTVGDVDFAVGKKMLRWSNGYAFAPAGVLDPPRRFADPTDRLGLNEGRGLALASLVHGRHSLTLAWVSAGLLEKSRPGLREITALRYNALVHGIDTSLIVAYRRGLGTFVASTFTAVLGSRFELHGDAAFGAGAEIVESTPFLRLDDHRRFAALLGTKVSLPGRVSGIIEVCSTDGLIPIAEPVAFTPLGALLTERRHHLFLHIGKGRLREIPGWRDWDVGAALLLGLSDGGRMLIVDVEHRVGQRFALHGRLSLPAGSSQWSEYGMIPWTARVSVGLRLQM